MFIFLPFHKDGFRWNFEEFGKVQLLILCEGVLILTTFHAAVLLNYFILRSL
jgi:hypothetical protein